jgi:dihydrofolate reductase
MHMSVDGYIEGKEHVDGAWVRIDEESHRFVNDLTARADTLLYGRKVYEVMIPYWPAAARDPDKPAFEQEFGKLWLDKPKVVFSRTMTEPQFNTRIVRGGIGGEVERLKKQSANHLLCFGGPNFVSSIRAHVDEYLLFVNPVALGRGVPFFRDAEELELLEARAFSAGVVLHRYRRR